MTTRDEITKGCALGIEKVLEMWCTADQMGLIVVRKGTVYEHGREAIGAALDRYTEALRAHILHTNGLLLLAAEGKAGRDELEKASVAGQCLLQAE